MNFLKGVAASAGSYVQAAARFNFDVAEPGQQIEKIVSTLHTGKAQVMHTGHEPQLAPVHLLPASRLVARVRLVSTHAFLPTCERAPSARPPTA